MFSNSRTFVFKRDQISGELFKHVKGILKNLLTIYYTETKYKKERGSK